MNVRQLVAFLQTQNQDMPVATQLYSEYCVLETGHINIRELCEARPDGWVHNKRPDEIAIPYLVIGE
jgi:hypothetical protein